MWENLLAQAGLYLEKRVLLGQMQPFSKVIWSPSGEKASRLDTPHSENATWGHL